MPGHLPQAQAQAQAQARGTGHGRDHGQRPGPGATQGFAGPTELAGPVGGQHLLHPGHETGVAARDIQLFKDAPIGIDGGRASGPGQVAAQQAFFLLPEKGDFFEVVGPAERVQHADGENVRQKMTKVFVLVPELRDLG